MKRFWSIFTVALVALGAVSCNNNFEESIIGESLSINVNIDNTRTALEQGENVWNTVWVGDETIVVSDGTSNFNFVNTAENKNKFTCEAVGVRSLIGKKVNVVYNSVIDSAAGAAGMTLTGGAESFSESAAIELTAGNAFLKFTSAVDVTLTASAEIFGNGTALQNSVTLKGENVLVPIYAAAEVTLTATIAEAKVKETVLTIANNKIYNLGTLEEAPATLTVSFNAVDSMMDPSMHGMPGIYLVNVANTTTNDFAMLLFYDNSNPFVALNGTYPVVAGSLGSTLESSCLLADPGYCQIILGGKTYIPVSGGIDVVTAMPSEDNNALVFNMVVADVENSKQYNLTGSMEENMIGAIGYGPSYIDFNITDWGFTTFEATYDENSANIIKLKSVSHNGEFVMELATENGDITTGSYNVMYGTLSGYYFDGTDIREYVFDGGQIAFEKGTTENGYILNVSTRADDWTMGGKYKVVAPENGYEITINFPVVEPVLSEYGVVGSFQGWDAANPVAMVIEDDWSVARGVELYKDDEIKVVKGKTWDVSYGPQQLSVLTVDTEHTLVSSNSQNIKIAKNGKFDISFNPTTKKFKYTCTEEYTDLKVDITVNNKANWSPLRVVLKAGNTLLTAAEGDLVENNKISVSGEYIGSTLSYQFFTDGKQSEVANVTISHNGATVTLEEDVILLTFKLDTANSKQYWGNTSKIHVWNTGTSFDTSWPGNTLIYDGNYTWHIVVPSELVGKTINYLIHNGNNWQSKDSKLTISAEGNTVTGSSIGIN